MDIATIAFVLSIIVVGILLTAAIRRDFVNRRRLRRDIQRKADHLRARGHPSGRP